MFKNIHSKHRRFSETGFRYRGLESSRLENLTDAVFAFAITLLVIASEVPKTYVELQASMYDFIGFIACILMLLALWSNHATYFLKYGLQDKRTKTLNFLFLFVLLFYIYPLKYLFSYIGSVQLVNMLRNFGFTSDAYLIALEKARLAQLSVDDWADIMIRFGIGLLAMHSILFGFFQNAYQNRKLFKLNKLELFETKTSMIAFLMIMVICILSIAIVVIGGGYYSGYSGMIYLAIPISLVLLKKIRGKKMKALNVLKTKRKKEAKKNHLKIKVTSKEQNEASTSFSATSNVEAESISEVSVEAKRFDQDENFSSSKSETDQKK